MTDWVEITVGYDCQECRSTGEVDDWSRHKSLGQGSVFLPKKDCEACGGSGVFGSPMRVDRESLIAAMGVGV